MGFCLVERYRVVYMTHFSQCDIILFRKKTGFSQKLSGHTCHVQRTHGNFETPAGRLLG